MKGDGRCEDPRCTYPRSVRSRRDDRLNRARISADGFIAIPALTLAARTQYDKDESSWTFIVVVHNVHGPRMTVFLLVAQKAGRGIN